MQATAIAPHKYSISLGEDPEELKAKRQEMTAKVPKLRGCLLE